MRETFKKKVDIYHRPGEGGGSEGGLVTNQKKGLLRPFFSGDYLLFVTGGGGGYGSREA